MVYEWKSGSRIKADAQKSGELFEQLSKTEEGLTASTLLEANKPETAPLHSEYEWNDEKAANEWRLHQSRHFINSIVTIAISDTAEEQQVRAFHIVTESSKYEPLTAIIKEESKYERLLINAMSELEAFTRKYSTLRELKPVIESIEKVKKNERHQANSHTCICVGSNPAPDTSAAG